MQHDFAPHALDRDAYNLRCRILTGLSVNHHTLDLCHFLNKVLFQRIHMCNLFIKILVDLHGSLSKCRCSRNILCAGAHAALLAAAKVAQRSMDSDDDKALVDTFLSEVGEQA